MYSVGDYGEMIADKVRMDPYVYALKAKIGPNSVVLDIGTGTGIHALLACKFGARKVYAIEPNEAIHLARELAQENGFADRIEFFQNVSTRVTLPERADVIVSDLRGVVPPYGRHIPSIIDARQRHLAPGGTLIPKRDTVWASLVEARGVYNGLVGPWDYPYGLAMEKAKQIVLNDWSEENTDTFRKSNLLMEPRIWTELDYMSIEKPDVGPSELTQKSTRDGTAHGILLWFDAFLMARGQKRWPRFTDAVSFRCSNRSPSIRATRLPWISTLTLSGLNIPGAGIPASTRVMIPRRSRPILNSLPRTVPLISDQ
jgi:protein arginine N-methyltransferase 1